MRISETRLINRMRWYLKSKMMIEDEERISKAEGTCREWLKWAGWFRLTHKERSELYSKMK